MTKQSSTAEAAAIPREAPIPPITVQVHVRPNIGTAGAIHPMNKAEALSTTTLTIATEPAQADTTATMTTGVMMIMTTANATTTGMTVPETSRRKTII